MKQDTILVDQPVMLAGKWPGAQTVVRDGRPGAQVPEGTWARFRFPDGDLPRSEYNYLVLDVYFPSAEVLSLVLETDVIPPGMENEDALHSLAWAPEPGWRTVPFPLESFVPYGMSSDFANVRRIGFHADCAGFLIGEMRLQVVEQPEGPRMTDVELLEALDLGLPELAQVRRLWDDGNVEVAVDALDEHFRRRTAPKHFYFDLIPPATQSTLEEADRMCEGYVQGFRFEDDINWRANPTGYQEWPVHLHYMSWTVPLLSAYRGTGDEKYARRLDEIIASYVRHNVRPVGHRGGFGNWAPHRPAARMTRCWPWTFYSTLQSPSFRTRTRLDMLKSWWEMTEHTLAWSLAGTRNFRLSDTRAIVMASMLLPEFRRASVWREEGLRRLREELTEQFNRDGVHYELAGYHEGCTESFFQVYHMAQLNGFDLGPDYESALHRMLDYSVHRVRPCGTVISHNDAGPFTHRVGAGGAKRLMARVMNRDDLRFVFGGDGQPPTETSRGFAVTGMYFMRGGWTRDDLCLFFDGAAVGAGHQHEDKLSIDVSAFGKEFIVDPGIHSYMLDRFRAYMSSSHAHNTLHLDGRPQNRLGRQAPGEWAREAGAENEWHTGKVLDFAKSQYDVGYGAFGPDEGPCPIHHRAVVFVRSEYFLVFDYVEGTGRHTIESMLHFAPMPVFIDGPAATFRTSCHGTANLEVICLPGMPTPSLSVVCGETDPPQGWVACDSGHPWPAPCAIMTWKQELPLTAGFLLVPSKEGRSANLEIEPVLREGASWAGRVRHPDGRSDFVLARLGAGGCVAVDDFRTDARVVVVRHAPGGSVVAKEAVPPGSLIPAESSHAATFP